MNRLKRLLRRIIARLLGSRMVRESLTLAHIPLAWMVIRLNGVFDKRWYQSQFYNERYQKIQSHAPLIHYLAIGRKKGLSPSPYFIPEVFSPGRWQHSIIDPLVKYLIYRKAWKRPTSIIFDPLHYRGVGNHKSPLVDIARRQKNDDTAYWHRNLAPYTKKGSGVTSIIEAMMDASHNRSDRIRRHLAAATTDTFDQVTEGKLIANLQVPAAKQRLVSIIMPAWNRQELIKEAIESVQAQTYSNWELLITDDGSTDETVAVIEGYSAGDDRIKVFTPGRGGVCKARNNSLQHANGEWIAFLDSDNTWTKDFLTVSIASLEAKDASHQASYSAIKMDNQGKVRYRTTPPDAELLKTGNYIDLNALVVSKKVLDKIGFFDETLRRMVDYDLVIRINEATKFIYVPVIGVNYTDHDDLVRISTSESTSWDGVVKSKNFIDWRHAGEDRDSELISIIIPVRGAASHVFASIENLLKYTPDSSIEIIIADASSGASANMLFAALTKLDDRIIHYREQAARDPVLMVNYAFERSKGSTIVILDPHVRVDEGWLNPLVDTVRKQDDSIVGPLQLKPNRTIRSAGVEFYGDNIVPVNVLEDHPFSDSSKLKQVYEVDALSNGCFAMSAAMFAKIHGLNPLYDGGFEVQEMSLRTRDEINDAKVLIAKKSCIVNPDGGRGWYSKTQDQFTQSWRDKARSATSSVWRTTGFSVQKYIPLDPQKGENSRVVPRLTRSGVTKKSLRWAIKISAPADERRFAWGDMYYAQALADALERQGQTVAIDFLGAHYRPTGYLDDINLDLRGLTPFTPQPDKTNILWVISHPDDVPIADVDAFDIVFAAGRGWSEYMTRKSNKTVQYLPQCTDPSVFNVQPRDKEFENKVLFVGNSRNVLRPIVRDAIAADLDVAVYGAGWENLIDKRYIKGTFIPNKKLAQAYGSARMVLNDHWDDMRKWGFLSNRLFDASASGVYILTDNISGAEEISESGTIRTYNTVDDLRGLIDSDWGAQSMTAAQRKRTSAAIARNHSFEARSREIIASALGANRKTGQ